MRMFHSFSKVHESRLAYTRMFFDKFTAVRV